MLQSYRQLRVWQKSMRLVAECYAVSRRLPIHERYVLAAQLRRAAISIPANIAEGYARRGLKEYLHFLSIACGSLAELDCHLQLLYDPGYAADSELAAARELVDAVSRMLRRLEQSLRARCGMVN